MVRAGGYPELGYTSDPVVLVPGSLSGLRADIDDLTARAEDLALAAEDLARGYVSSWEGETAVAANEHRVALVDALTVNSDLYRVVATVLAGHVDTLRWARARASVAVRLWEQAKALGAVEIRGPATPSSRRPRTSWARAAARTWPRPPSRSWPLPARRCACRPRRRPG